MSKKFGKILIVDDDEDILHAARLFLKQHATLIETENDPKKIPARLRDETYDVVFLDMNFARGATSGQEGFFWLRKILEADASAAVVMITAFGDVQLAVRAIREGAVDFILKPWQNEKLLATLSAAFNLRKSRLEAEALRSRQRQLSADLDQPFHDFIGLSPAMKDVFATIQKVAGTDANILILGENGTGKELVARELHRQSHRSAEVFISVDMGAISETLFESELFGHLKGAFTDARDDRAGRFEIASGGTLFLDEIGNLSLPLQAKLLSVLETRQIIRVGSNKPIPIDVRLICATNMPIQEMIAQNKFRQDLLYRINTVEIHMPSLQERSGDIPLLAEHFLNTYSRKYGKRLKKISPAALTKLGKYTWPGNVRELQHAVERSVIMSDTAVLQPEDFFLPPQKLREEGPAFEDCNLEKIEKLIIRRAITKHGGNISQAAQELGLSRASLYRRLEKYGL